MLFAAARADHVDSLIKPALDRGDWVLCDRYADSTRVYQGEAGVDTKYLDLLETAAVAGIRPELTILIDVPADVGLSRVAVRSKNDDSGGPDRFEGEDLSVHERRRQLFLDLAKSESYRFVVIDGSMSLNAVETAVLGSVQKIFADEFSEGSAEQQAAEGDS